MQSLSVGRWSVARVVVATLPAHPSSAEPRGLALPFQEAAITAVETAPAAVLSGEGDS